MLNIMQTVQTGDKIADLVVIETVLVAHYGYSHFPAIQLVQPRALCAIL